MTIILNRHFCSSLVIYSIPSTQGVGHRKRLSTSEGCHAGSPVEFQKYAKDTGMDSVDMGFVLFPTKHWI